MIIECHQCKARVDAEEVGCVAEEEAFWPKRTYLLRCPVCKTALVGECFDFSTGKGQKWSELVRVHPEPGRAASLSESSGLPKIVIDSLKEAEKCLQVGAYLAAAAMAGRAVEGICRHFSVKGSYLSNGLKELKDRGVIDARLYEWGEALRDERNKASHAEDATLSARDAEDILAFTYAIADYVFLLTKKFEAFKKRKMKTEPQQSTPGDKK
jgi:hypothetical protein